jgi:adenosylcobinamide-GDP ribazoletransferase
MPLPRPVRHAFAFLTVLPAGIAPAWRDDDGPRLVLGFPVVGLALGGIFWAAAPWLAVWLRPEAAAVALAALIVGLTGALHLDGLCDVADGAFAERSPAERRRIARDPHLGVYGMASGVFYLLALVAVCMPPVDVRALALAPVVARTLVLPWLALAPLSEGSHFAAALRPTRRTLVIALVIGVAAVAGVVWAFGPLPPTTLALPLGMAIVVTTAAGLWLIHQLGGLSGDIAGALIALGELTVLGFWP